MRALTHRLLISFLSLWSCLSSELVSSLTLKPKSSMAKTSLTCLSVISKNFGAFIQKHPSIQKLLVRISKIFLPKWPRQTLQIELPLAISKRVLGIKVKPTTMVKWDLWWVDLSARSKSLIEKISFNLSYRNMFILLSFSILIQWE